MFSKGNRREKERETKKESERGKKKWSEMEEWTGRGGGRKTDRRRDEEERMECRGDSKSGKDNVGGSPPPLKEGKRRGWLGSKNENRRGRGPLKHSCSFHLADIIDVFCHPYFSTPSSHS
ncbi:hypothetical protein KM043_011635 [Ampulex compressa]|nr:hypothetical protein KM043_011635 [Ampulex compressa]